MRIDPDRRWALRALALSSLVALTVSVARSAGDEPGVREAELDAIHKQARAVAADLNSRDPAVVRNAEAQRQKVVNDFQAWAKKHQLEVKREEVAPTTRQARRRCPFYFLKTTEVDGQIEQEFCVNVGETESRCVNLCVTYTLPKPERK
jgi:hypothetical protein